MISRTILHDNLAFARISQNLSQKLNLVLTIRLIYNDNYKQSGRI